MQRETVIIECTHYGYFVYGKPYWYLGHQYKPLLFSARTIDECIEFTDKKGFDYILDISKKIWTGE